MRVEWHRLGEYIEECVERNDAGRFGVSELLGVNSRQQFCPSKAKTEGIDFRSYKVVHNDEFAYNPARLDIGSIAKFEGKVCIVSTLYEVFRIKQERRAELLPGFLQIYFAREEFARYVGFKNWGSAREYFWLDAMKRAPIPVPPIDEQRRVVEAWQGLRRMKEENEQMAEPLMTLCRSYMQELKKKWPMKPLQGLVTPKEERNRNLKLKADTVRGLGTNKEMIETKANLEGVDLSTYKLVKPQEFAYVSDTTRRGDKVSMGFNESAEVCLVSSISTVFSVTDIETLLPEFLFTWFCRDEFDRTARFNSWGSARETFNWSDMCRVMIPLPPKDVQESVVAVYRAAMEAKRIAAEADELSRQICPALIQHVVRGGK